MRPFRSLRAAIVVALLLLGLLGNVADAQSLVRCVPEDPPPSLAP